LTHEALTALRQLRRIQPKTEHVFESVRTVVGLNKWLKSLCERAKIKTRGRIRFHLIRKYTFSQLSASGMNAWEAKLCIGKTIPLDILTYLKGQEEILREKFISAEDRLTLSGFTNSNHTKLGKVSEEIEELKEIIKDQAKEKRQQDIKIEVLTDEVEKQERLIQGLRAIATNLQRTVEILSESLGKEKRKA
jgi:hypothetical protein